MIKNIHFLNASIIKRIVLIFFLVVVGLLAYYKSFGRGSTFTCCAAPAGQCGKFRVFAPNGTCKSMGKLECVAPRGSGITDDCKIVRFGGAPIPFSASKPAVTRPTRRSGGLLGRMLYGRID